MVPQLILFVCTFFDEEMLNSAYGKVNGERSK